MISWIGIELGKRGLDLLLIPDEPGEKYQSLIHLVETRRVDALIVAHTQPEDFRLQYLQKQNFPFLALGRSHLPKPYAWFDFDNHAGASLAVKRLLELGHQRIAFVSTDARISYVDQRLQGYVQTMSEAGLMPLAGYLQKRIPLVLAVILLPRVYWRLRFLLLPLSPTVICWVMAWRVRLIKRACWAARGYRLL